MDIGLFIFVEIKPFSALIFLKMSNNYLTKFESERILRAPSRLGAIAQLGERYTGSVEVGGSIPPSSTILNVLLSSRIGFNHR